MLTVFQMRLQSLFLLLLLPRCPKKILLQKEELLPKPSNLLMGLNLGFATSLLLVALLFIYIVFIQSPFELSDSDMLEIINR